MDKWDVRFMDMAKLVSTWSSCYQQNRQVGAVIVKDKRIITTGYNGAPSGVVSCKDKGECLRRKLNIASGTHAELCYAVHAEQNAISDAARRGVSLNGCTAYITHFPCVNCAKLLVAAGIAKVKYLHDYHNDELALKFFEDSGVEITKL